MTHRFLGAFAPLSLLLVGVVACDQSVETQSSTPSAAPSSAASASALPEAATAPNPYQLHVGATTPADTAVRNLGAQIAGREGILKRREDLQLRVAVVDLYLSRAQYLGTYDDFDRVLEHVKAALEKHPKKTEPYLMQASVAGALHRFGEALKALDQAEKLGAKPEQVAARRQTIRLAQGLDVAEVLAARKTLAEQQPSYASLTALAAAQVASGQFDEADQSFVNALKSYRDVSPFPVAWVTFQRGVMWAEHAGKPEKALPLYTEAVRRLAPYVVANVHLAELELEAGNAEGAKRRLMSVVDPARDPEPSGVLGELLQADAKHPEDAGAHIDAAKKRYDQLLKKYPEAFADHGAEFFMGPGKDPARALKLAELNLKNRQTERAYMLLISAAETAGKPARACELLKLPRFAASAPKPHNPELEKQLSGLSKSCK